MTWGFATLGFGSISWPLLSCLCISIRTRTLQSGANSLCFFTVSTFHCQILQFLVAPHTRSLSPNRRNNFPPIMSRAPPPGGPGRYGGPGLPGSNPRAPPPGQGYGAPQGYGSQQGYGSPQGAPQGYGDPRAAQRSPNMPRYSEKAPGPSGGSGSRQVALRVEKPTDKSLQSRLIYGNL